jgi:hypothetical protein
MRLSPSAIVTSPLVCTLHAIHREQDLCLLGYSRLQTTPTWTELTLCPWPAEPETQIAYVIQLLCPCSCVSRRPTALVAWWAVASSSAVQGAVVILYELYQLHELHELIYLTIGIRYSTVEPR